MDVNLIRVLATVKDAGGHLVGDLDQNGFLRFRDNGAPQKVANFERRTEQPLLVSLLIDNSGSTAKDLKYEIDSVNRFLHALFAEGNPQDSLALYTFNYEKFGYWPASLGTMRPLRQSSKRSNQAAGAALL